MRVSAQSSNGLRGVLSLVITLGLSLLAAFGRQPKHALTNEDITKMVMWTRILPAFAFCLLPVLGLPKAEEIVKAFKLLDTVPIGVIELRNGSVGWKEEPPAPGKVLLMAPGSAAQDGNQKREETSNVTRSYFKTLRKTIMKQAI